VRSFEFHSVPRVVFGRGEIRRLGEFTAALGRSAMVVYNGGGVGERIAAVLGAAGVESVLRRQRGEPVVADVDAAVEAARTAGCDMVVGLGGGGFHCLCHEITPG